MSGGAVVKLTQWVWVGSCDWLSKGGGARAHREGPAEDDHQKVKIVLLL